MGVKEPLEETVVQVEASPFDYNVEKLVDLIDTRNITKFQQSFGDVDLLTKGLHSSAETGLVGVVDPKLGEDAKKKDAAAHDHLLPKNPKIHEDRIRVFGRNVLPPAKSLSIFELMWGALQDQTLILLGCASIISLGVGLFQDFKPSADPNEPKTHWIEGFAIIVAVVIVVLAASINDYQKESQFRKLNAKKENRQVKVLRDGNIKQISVYHVLVGDILLLEPGDITTADGVLVTGMNLRMDESAATGESDTIKKSPGHDPFILSGSKVAEGIGRYIVTAIGVNSFFGKTMMALRTESEDTPLQVKLDGLAEKIAKLGASAAITMFLSLLIKYLIQTLIGDGFGNGPNQQSGELAAQQLLSILISAITLVVVAVPEGLPLAVTLALAYATSRMLKDNNLVRVLSACETMGGATTVCSDKTGTLTTNRMTVVKGVIGKTLEFEGDDQLADVVKTIAISRQSPEFTSSTLLNVLLEGIAINSSAFEEINSESKASIFVGSKTEVALLEFCQKWNVDYKSFRQSKDIAVIQIYPFSSERKSMATLVRLEPTAKSVVATKNEEERVFRIHVKGASEIVLKYCDKVAFIPKKSSSNEPALLLPLDRQITKEYGNIITSFAELSLRTICLAYRDFTESEFLEWIQGPIREKVAEAKRRENEPKFNEEENGLIIREKRIEESGSDAPLNTTEDEELTDEDILAHPLALAELGSSGLTCVGIVGIEDPLRAGVPEAVAICQKAGVIVRMVTGDNIITAKAIGMKCGIFTPGGIAMEGAVFRKLGEEEMDNIIPRLQVLARSSPTDKQLLVSRLKFLGETVAVTGDGTNDGPALKMADIGFSMGIAGTEVAKEASSIILMDDNFASIVKAMMWGRSVNDSVKKFLQFQLTVNVTAVTVTFVSSIVDSKESSVLTAVQLLWVNLIMDTLAALALATEAPSPEILDRPPENKRAPLLTMNMWKMILGQSILQVTINFGFLFGGTTLFGLNNLEEHGGIMGHLEIEDSVLRETVEHERDILRTIIFNTFVFLQVFNMINCRRIDNNLNVLKGIHLNPFFYMIFVFVAVGQAVIVQFGGYAFKTTPITGVHWVICLAFGFLSLPWGIAVRLVPNSIFQFMSVKKRVEPVENNSLEGSRANSDLSRTSSELKMYQAIRGSTRIASRGSSRSMASLPKFNDSKKVLGGRTSSETENSRGSFAALPRTVGSYVAEPVKMKNSHH